ncbi:MAG: TlyA family rRNA (cytidine-2'-O)-methyltransferase [Candidatus Dormibacteria bacterium]
MGGIGAARRLITVLQKLEPGIDAERAIAAGEVLVDGVVVTNPRSMLRTGVVVQHRLPAALRGETKLAAGLGLFGVDPAGLVALDVGASTGGFTSVLLARGATRVYAVDAGHGQLLGRLRQDPRVVNLESTNLGVLDTGTVPDPIGLLTVDVSYLSLSAAVAQLSRRLRLDPGATLLGLVKPMFELRLGDAPGDAPRLRQAIELARAGTQAAGWTVEGTGPSPVLGANGAVEGWVHARWPGPAGPAAAGRIP